jgi:predicted kinase
MSGAPGSGKSTIADALARQRGFVILDHDVVKNAQLAAGLPFAEAGRLSYSVLLAMAEDLLRQGHSVIIDSPCFYEALLHGGQAAADRTGAVYRYLECVTDDLDVLDHRLLTRRRVASQVTGVDQAPRDGSDRPGRDVFRDWIDNMKRPASGFFRLDTTRPIEKCIEEALAFLDDRRGFG